VCCKKSSTRCGSPSGIFFECQVNRYSVSVEQSCALESTELSLKLPRNYFAKLFKTDHVIPVKLRSLPHA